MKKLTLTIVAFLGLIAGAMAQSTATHQVDITINSVAMLRAVKNDAGTATNSVFTVGAPTTAGAKPNISGTNIASVYLQYTSIKTASGTPRTIKATLSGTIPAGLSISAVGALPTGGTGDTGTTVGGGELSTTARALINGIGSGYTGADAGKGANITYSSEISAMADLKVTASTTLTVTYTLSNE